MNAVRVFRLLVASMALASVGAAIEVGCNRSWVHSEPPTPSSETPPSSGPDAVGPLPFELLCTSAAGCMPGEICCVAEAGLELICQRGPCGASSNDDRSIQLCATAAECLTTGDVCRMVSSTGIPNISPGGTFLLPPDAGVCVSDAGPADAEADIGAAGTADAGDAAPGDG